MHFVGDDDADGDRRSVLIRCNDHDVDDEFGGGADSDDSSSDDEGGGGHTRYKGALPGRLRKKLAKQRQGAKGAKGARGARSAPMGLGDAEPSRADAAQAHAATLHSCVAPCSRCSRCSSVLGGNDSKETCAAAEVMTGILAGRAHCISLSR